MTSTRSAILASERSRRLTAGVVTSILSRGLGMLAPLALIPITLSYLGADLYGLWMAVLALCGMALWADLGLGNGLMTKLGPCYAGGDFGAARRYIATTYAVLSAAAVALLAALWGLSGVISWTAVFNVTDPQVAGETRAVALLVLSVFVINVPLSLVQRVQYAYQQVAQSNIWQAVGSLSSLLLVLLAIQAELDPVLVIGAAVAGPLIGNVLSSAWLYGRRSRQLAPTVGDVDPTVVAPLLRLGGQFFLLSLVTSIAMNSDNLVIAHALDLQAVTDFSVPARLFAALGLLVTLVNLPLWPANSEALARGDVAWVRQVTVRMTLGSAAVILVPGVILMLLGNRMLQGWLGSPRPTSLGLMAALVCWWLLVATTSPRFMVQNSAGLVRPQLLGWAAFLIVSVPAKWIGARHLGIAAVPAVGAAAYLLTVWPVAQHGYRRTLSATASTSEEE